MSIRHTHHRARPREPRGRSAIVLADATVALLIVSILTVTFTQSLGRQRRASESLARQRDATRLAESVITGMQSLAGEPRDAESSAGMTVRVNRADGGTPPAGFEWVTVTVEDVDGQGDDEKAAEVLARLTGLVPERAHGASQPARRTQ